jgi:hypothetical protein
MADQMEALEAAQDQAEPNGPPKIVIGLQQPDQVTGWVWECYCTGRADFFKRHPLGSGRYADYAGGIACVKAGYFTITAPQTIMRYLDDENYFGLPAEWIGLVEREVVNYIEAAYRRPSPLWEIVKT